MKRRIDYERKNRRSHREYTSLEQVAKTATISDVELSTKDALNYFEERRSQRGGNKSSIGSNGDSSLSRRSHAPLRPSELAQDNWAPYNNELSAIGDSQSPISSIPIPPNSMLQSLERVRMEASSGRYANLPTFQGDDSLPRRRQVY